MIVLISLAAVLASAPSPQPAAPTPPPKVHASAHIPNFAMDTDYPIAALRRHEQGTVGYRIDIDATGAVAACTIVQSSGSASLDSGTCDLFRNRARFTPARDAEGRAVPDYYVGRITWRFGH